MNLLIFRGHAHTAVLLFLLLLTITGTARADSPIRISLQENTLNGLERLKAVFDCELHEIESIPPGSISRPKADLIIIAKALWLGGLHEPLEFIPACNARRETEEVAMGRTVMAGQQFDTTALLKTDYVKEFYVSEPITRTGEFQKGFFCLESNKAVLGMKTTGELARKTKGAIGLHWENDARILNAMGINNLLRVPTFPSIIKMVGVGRADWIPLEISRGKDSVLTMFGYRLVPIPGIKFSLIDSRHFIVSRENPDGKRVFTALQKGLAELRRRGFIHEALVACGFLSADTADWTLLNKNDVERAKANTPPSF